LKSSTSDTVESIFKFCNLEITNKTYSFLNESSEKKISDTYSVFRGGIDCPVTLNDKLVKKISEYVGDAKLSKYIDS